MVKKYYKNGSIILVGKSRELIHQAGVVGEFDESNHIVDA